MAVEPLEPRLSSAMGSRKRSIWRLGWEAEEEEATERILRLPSVEAWLVIR